MATELDLDLVPDIGTLINDELGAAAVFKVVVSGGVYDPSTSRTSAEVTTDVAQKITPPGPLSDRYIGLDILRGGELETLIAGEDLTFTPQLNQRMVYLGKLWTIVHVDPIPSGDEICAYALIMRHGPTGA